MRKENTAKRIAISVVLLIICFVIGYSIGWIIKINDPVPATPPGSFVNHYEEEQEDSLPAEAKAEHIVPEETVQYMVSTEDGVLVIYMIEHGEKKVIKSEDFAEGVLPPDDQKQLSDGIETDTLEDALQVWESFVG